MTKREIGDLAPIREALRQVAAKQEAAASVKDERVGAVLADVHKLLSDAIDDAVRPESGDGLTVEEYARRHEVTPWAVYKRIQRGELEAKKAPNGHLTLPAA